MAGFEGLGEGVGQDVPFLEDARAGYYFPYRVAAA